MLWKPTFDVIVSDCALIPFVSELVFPMETIILLNSIENQ